MSNYSLKQCLATLALPVTHFKIPAVLFCSESSFKNFWCLLNKSGNCERAKAEVINPLGKE